MQANLPYRLCFAAKHRPLQVPFAKCRAGGQCVAGRATEPLTILTFSSAVQTPQVMLHHTAVTRWDTGKLLRIIRSISVGVNNLHTTQPAVLHRDLKPGNIFVDTGQARH